ncbi:RNA polymerase sigma factor [Parvicella tangerina]|uniref:ECF RNA polymerase sigma factor SigR n=1 Tax=Parvicella tangerina TaxID=2829795 RepID=A0A916JQ02_9FLAO|nr:sigma-70 family RNA polymerase sigma factor [Parvicella tangerina]CAG5086532.1 ECF RNA polymerase sigma factor SigR [Parvicella tangerina]
MTVLEFNYQVTTFQDKLNAFARTLTKDEEDAKDLFQETVLKAMKYRDKFVSPTNLKAWLYTIMKNTFINDYRRRKLVTMIHDDSPNSFMLNSQTSQLQSQTSQLYTEEILSKINNLDEEYSVPFMKHVEGFKYKEISDELNLPIGTVKSRIYMARQQLMEELKEFRA